MNAIKAIFAIIATGILTSRNSVSGFMFSKMLNTQPSVRLFGIGLSSCMRECDLRPACKSVNYRRMTHECLLNDKDDSDSTLKDTAGFVYHKKTNHDNCGSDACSYGQICSEIKHTCIVEECSTGFSHKTLGNLVTLGSTRKCKCTAVTRWLSTTEQAPAILFPKCQDDGQWTVSKETASLCFGLSQYHLVSGRKGVADKSLTASSSWNLDLVPKNARLNNWGCWSSATLKTEIEYIQVEFPVMKLVRSIVTQGRPDVTQYVTKYMVSYSQSCRQFQHVLNNSETKKIFDGNIDTNTPVTNELPRPVLARCVRIHAVEYKHYISLRFDVIGSHI